MEENQKLLQHSGVFVGIGAQFTASLTGTGYVSVWRDLSDLLIDKKLCQPRIEELRPTMIHKAEYQTLKGSSKTTVSPISSDSTTKYCPVDGQASSDGWVLV